VQALDHIECRILKTKPVTLQAENIPIDILFEDDWLIVVNKPAGMVVHPAYGHRTGTLVNAILHHVGFEGNEADPGLSTAQAGPRYEGDPTVRPGLVHRLDKDTTGILVVAKTDTAHTLLSRQLADRTMMRTYSALLLGVPETDRGRIETNLGRDPRDRKLVTVKSELQGKKAITRFRTVEVFQHASLVEFKLETGRTHQIRVHAQHMGCPVLGDHSYGGRKLGRWQKGTEGYRLLSECLKQIDRQALHARILGFRHPDTGRLMCFESAIPQDMRAVLDTLRRNLGRPG
jgi:23S rRNA pseudouridine1911/1915/1917 synthase